MCVLRELQRYIAERDITAATAQKLRHRVNCWKRLSPSRDSHDVTPAVFDAFRQSALAAGLSRRTIEETVSDVARICGVNDIGNRLRRWKSAACKAVPSPQLLGYAYANADQAQWPNDRLCRTESLIGLSAGDFWRGFLVFAYFTGLRLRDLRSITWAAIDYGFIWEASKTGKTHLYPESAVVMRNIRPLRTSGSERVFPLSRSQERLIRRELKRIGGAELTPQAIRRASVTQWSLANANAGRIIHGTGLGVMSHYLDARRILAAALPKLAMPTEFLTEEERDQRSASTGRILSIVDRIPIEKLEDLERVAAAFAG